MAGASSLLRCWLANFDRVRSRESKSRREAADVLPALWMRGGSGRPFDGSFSQQGLCTWAGTIYEQGRVLLGHIKTNVNMNE